jgi:hypothetical protein
MINAEFAKAEANERKFRSWRVIFSIPMVAGMMILVAMSRSPPRPTSEYLFSRSLRFKDDKSDTSEEDPNPTQTPTVKPTYTPPTALPTHAPTGKPPNSPNTSAPKNPTQTPTVKPTHITGKPNNITGETCSSDADCASNVCIKNTCFASEECKDLKHDGTPFDTKKIILVFVGSNFADLEVWQSQVVTTASAFDKYPMLKADIGLYNIFYVNTLEPSFCFYNCYGIQRLLCCDLGKARELADKCFLDNGSTLQTIVIHNDIEYGGAGYVANNVATTSVHNDAPDVAVNELGHSLFELADEYANGWGDATIPNCDNAGCPKWADLVTQGLATCSIAACQDGNYLTGERSFMEFLGNPVGHVNLRFTCCTYLALTKQAPSYCDIYDTQPGKLLSYCQQDYQGYGDVYSPVPYLPVSTETGRTDVKKKYSPVSQPVTIVFKASGSIVSMRTSTPTQGHAGLFPISKVWGDFASLEEAAASGLTTVFEVTVHYASGKSEAWLMNPYISVEVPLQPKYSMATEPSSPSRVSVRSDLFEIVVDTGNGHGNVVSIDVQEVPTGR